MKNLFHLIYKLALIPGEKVCPYIHLSLGVYYIAQKLGNTRKLEVLFRNCSDL